MKKNIGQVQPDKKEGLVQNNALLIRTSSTFPLMGKMPAVSYRSGVNLTMSCKGHRNTCWVNTQPIKGAAHNGFTLMEILIVVLIIGILTAVAVPQYQKAVLKSRFSSLMPTTKSIADSQEAYYMTNNTYSIALSDLDVTVTNDNETQITIGSITGYNYVKATRSDLNNKNNLIVYQKHSENFPGEIHCEALKDDVQANWLCGTALNGQRKTGALTEGYTTYILGGSGNGMMLGACENAPNITCSASEIRGSNTCEVITNRNCTVTKKICTNSSSCVYRFYSDNTTFTSCETSTCQLENGKVVRIGAGNITKIANGVVVERSTRGSCSIVNEDGSCEWYSNSWDYEYEYADGHEVYSTARRCHIYNEDGSCRVHSNATENTWEYDSAGRTKASSQHACTTHEDGSCATYTSGYYTETEYDSTGQTLRQRKCATLNEDGSCLTYKSGDDFETILDSNGKRIQTRSTRWTCEDWDASGACSSYYTANSANFAKYATENTARGYVYHVAIDTYDPSTYKQSSQRIAMCQSFTGTTCSLWATYTVPYVNNRRQPDQATLATCSAENFDTTTMTCLN